MADTGVLYFWSAFPGKPSNCKPQRPNILPRVQLSFLKQWWWYMYFSYFFLILISQFCVFQGIQTGVGICKPPWAPSHINSTETWQECQPSKMSQWTDPSSLLPTSKDLVLCLAQYNTVKKTAVNIHIIMN